MAGQAAKRKKISAIRGDGQGEHGSRQRRGSRRTAESGDAMMSAPPRLYWTPALLAPSGCCILYSLSLSPSPPPGARTAKPLERGTFLQSSPASTPSPLHLSAHAVPRLRSDHRLDAATRDGRSGRRQAHL